MLSSILNISGLLDVIRFVVVLSVLVLVHELGHFLAARKNGIWVEEFGIGFPPRVWGKKVGETLYSVNLIPLGGFVRLHGEQTEEGVTKPERAFINKSKKVRFFVLVAGVLMNFLLAVLCFSVYYSFVGVPRKTGEVLISAIIPGSPADQAGLKPSEVIVSAGGIKINSVTQFSEIVQLQKGTEMAIEVQPDGGGNLKTVNITPRVDVPQNEGPLGVLISDTELYFPVWWQRPFLGIYYGIGDALYWGGQIVSGLYLMVRNLFMGTAPKDIAGVVGIYAMTTEVAKLGVLELVNFVGIISVNLAIVNFLPIPALDGGRFIFIIIERVFGKKVVPKVEAAIHGAGMIALLSLFALITFVEVRRLVSAGGSLQGFLENTLK